MRGRGRGPKGPLKIDSDTKSSDTSCRVLPSHRSILSASMREGAFPAIEFSEICGQLLIEKKEVAKIHMLQGSMLLVRRTPMTSFVYTLNSPLFIPILASTELSLNRDIWQQHPAVAKRDESSSFPIAVGLKGVQVQSKIVRLIQDK